jgi:hypothetical protein
MAAYGVDAHRVSPRRLAVLLDQLPPSARQGGEPWSVEAHLLALLVDHVAYLTWVQLRAAGAKNPPRPRPLPRPPEGRARPAEAVLEPPRAASGAEGWDEAARQLAIMPGVVVEHG